MTAQGLVLADGDDFLVIEYRPQRGDAPHGLDIWQCDDVGTKMLGYQPITSGSPPLFNFAA